MSPSRTAKAANPVCTIDPDLPPPPALESGIDPAEPHPGEPGAPPDAPAIRRLYEDYEPGGLAGKAG